MAFRLANVDYGDEVISTAMTSSDLAKSYCCLSMIYAQQDNYRQSVQNYKKMLRLGSNWVDAMNNIACVLSNAFDSKFRNPDKTVKLAEKSSQKKLIKENQKRLQLYDPERPHIQEW